MSYSTRINMQGKVINGLRVLAYAFTVKKNAIWMCECLRCGGLVYVRGGDLRRKDGREAKACVDCSKKRHGHTSRGYQSPTYRCWRSMHSRCKRCIGYIGIKICKRWYKFDNFLKDMGVRPSLEYSVDRIDYRGGYTPENCRWATAMEQARNQRKNVWITLDGKRRILMDWIRHFKIDPTTYYDRLKRGMTPEQALTTKYIKTAKHKLHLSLAVRKLNPAQHKKILELRADGWTVQRLAEKYKVSMETMRRYVTNSFKGNV